MAADDYLWDARTRTSRDADVVELERVLRPLRQAAPPLETADVAARADASRSRRRVWRAGVAAATIMTLAAGVLWDRVRPQRVTVQPLAGVPLVNRMPGVGAELLAAGAVVETDGISRARLTVGRGSIAELRPASRLRVVRADASEQRLALDRGDVFARLTGSAPPFVLEMPFAAEVEAREQACAFGVRVDSTGGGELAVREGRVALASGGERVILPAGNEARFGEGGVPGLPFPVSSASGLRAIVRAVGSGSPTAEQVRAILSAADEASTITLFHLLPRVRPEDRPALVNRIAAFVPPPPGVTRDGLARLDPAMLARWEPTLLALWEREPVRWWEGGGRGPGIEP